jgi:probable rRNA maturation factor
MVEVVNRQRKVKIDCKRWRSFSEKALPFLPVTAQDLTVAFVSDRKMSELNRAWRKKVGTTDVLSFPAQTEEFEETGTTNLGDVVISLEQAQRQAKENGLRLNDEVAQLILHGMIHLCGYDHDTDDGEMNRLELRLRRKLKI